MDFLTKNVQYLKGVGEKRALQLKKLGITTINDLIYFFPKKYIDYSQPIDIISAPFDEASVIKATVLSKSAPVRLPGGKTLFKLRCADETASANITFFNAEFTVKRLEVGKEYLFYSKLGGNYITRELTSPIFISAASTVTNQGIYPLTQGISCAMLSKYISSAFLELPCLPDFLPDDIIKDNGLVSLDFALKSIHFPKNSQDLSLAKERLIFDEFLILQLGIALMGENKNKTTSIIAKDTDLTDFYSQLSFSLTAAQKNAIDDIARDFKSGEAMNRLLQGDVGSGKTLVGAAGAYIMSRNGYQSCIMAPTEILATQHFNSISSVFKNLNISVALLTSSTKSKEKKKIFSELADGSIHLLVGTHSVLSDNVVFKSLGFCITDEQQRFGVSQRTRFGLKGENPHLLVMSATPIPRTLAIIIYANMQISIIDEMPKGRKPILTYFVQTALRARMFKFIEKHVVAGHQCYIVLPSIEENDAISDLQSIMGYYENSIKLLVPHLKTGLLHGKLRPQEKESIMASFKNGDLDILCSTTVVEVGVDVPNATVMVIENAERYGLSAIHQLRGRVGRGDAQSYCILVSDNKSKNVTDRLQFLSSTQDGFKVSQYDLDNRGPGDFFGARQHGLPTLRIAQLSQDISTLQASQIACKKLLDADSSLLSYPLLKARLDTLFSDTSL